jgi:hypothetical protein
LIADFERLADSLLRDGFAATAQQGEDPRGEIGGLRGDVGACEGQARGIGGIVETNREGAVGFGGAVLRREDEIEALAAEVEVGIAPGVEIGAAAKRHPRGLAVGLAGVMDEEDGEGETALEGAQIGQKGRDVGGGIFVDAMEADERIEDEEARAEGIDGVEETKKVALDIEPELGIEDEVDGEGGEIDVADASKAFETPADFLGRFFGGEEEDGAGLERLEGAEAGAAGGDGEGHVEGEPALAALGSAADDADGLRGPKAVDQKAGVLRRGRGDSGDGEDMKRGDVRRVAHRSPPE